eukprot:1154305-Pelagomonas_calceolata.AAC.11
MNNAAPPNKGNRDAGIYDVMFGLGLNLRPRNLAAQPAELCQPTVMVKMVTMGFDLQPGCLAAQPAGLCQPNQNIHESRYEVIISLG